jgi:nucleoside phosphorylase
MRHVPCVVFALSRESAPFLRWFSSKQDLPEAPCRARFCRSQRLTAIVLETGVGPLRTQQALDWLLDQPARNDDAYRPHFIVSAGFSGALQKGYGPGDIVLATAVVDCDGRCWPVTLPLIDSPPSVHRGRLVTVPAIIGSPEQKEELGRRYRAVAADMETAAVARWCHEHGVPFGCVRAISDDVQTPLSCRLLNLLSRERVSPLRVLRTLVTNPDLIREGWRLAGHTKLAAKRLPAALIEICSRTSLTERLSRTSVR